jgi:hemoglobin/transferrin/lactoferrin receptor protein
MRKALLLACAFTVGAAIRVQAQNDTLKEQRMDELFISANKWEQKINEVPNKITKTNKTQILKGNPQTSADLLFQTGAVFVQKSQLGGGSPMIRGFATNRVLLVVDGVRMNNAIYRSGNLQNVISIDPLAVETAEVIFGPGSLIYGSDAIGGVMDFHTLQPGFSSTEKKLVRGSTLTRYATANNEKTIHADLNIGGRKFSVLSSVSFSDFDDLKMGYKGPAEGYLRPEYATTIGGKDTIVQNEDPLLQKYSGYRQLNLLQKLRYKPTETIDLQYSFTYARTGDAPRYDRLIQYRNNRLRFAEWYYGPMLWHMHHIHAYLTQKNVAYDGLQLSAAYQNYKESRIDRAFKSSIRTIQAEQVKALSINADATKKVAAGSMYYGVELIYNKVNSTGVQTNIVDQTVTPFNSRYPDGSTWSSGGAYAGYKANIHPKITVSGGLRYSYNRLQATFDTTFIKFPYQQANLMEGAVTGNAAIILRPAAGWQLNALFSTGYRMPNIDDIGKLFESAPGNVIVPNPQLNPEYAWNYELGIVKSIPQKLKVELSGFYTSLTNAIARRPFSINGNDSLDFDGSVSRIEALQNVASAEVWGLQAGARVYLAPKIYLQTNANITKGKETDDEDDKQVPLRHAPPFFGSTHLNAERNKWSLELYSVYNSEISNAELAPSEQAKKEIYATDGNGDPYAPAWYTINLKGQYKFSRHWQISAGWENITNKRYRPYASGIVAAGSNFILSVRAAL